MKYFLDVDYLSKGPLFTTRRLADYKPFINISICQITSGSVHPDVWQTVHEGAPENRRNRGPLTLQAATAVVSNNKSMTHTPLNHCTHTQHPRARTTSKQTNKQTYQKYLPKRNDQGSERTTWVFIWTCCQSEALLGARSSPRWGAARCPRGSSRFPGRTGTRWRWAPSWPG